MHVYLDDTETKNKLLYNFLYTIRLPSYAVFFSYVNSANSLGYWTHFEHLIFLEINLNNNNVSLISPLEINKPCHVSKFLLFKNRFSQTTLVDNSSYNRNNNYHKRWIVTMLPLVEVVYDKRLPLMPWS